MGVIQRLQTKYPVNDKLEEKTHLEQRKDKTLLECLPLSR